jgi:hypothetical protein
VTRLAAPKIGASNVTVGQSRIFPSGIMEYNTKYQGLPSANCDNIKLVTHIFEWNF